MGPTRAEGRRGRQPADADHPRGVTASAAVMWVTAALVVGCTYAVPNLADPADGSASVPVDARAAPHDAGVDGPDATSPGDSSSSSVSDASQDAATTDPDAVADSSTAVDADASTAVDADAEGTLDAGGDAGVSVGADATGPGDSGSVGPPGSEASAPDSGSVAAVLGDYTCSLSYTISLSSPLPATSNPSGSASLSVTASGGLLVLTLAGSGASCTLAALPDASGTTATLDPPTTQSCTFTTSAYTLTGTFSMGGTVDFGPNTASTTNLPFVVSGPAGLAGSGTLSSAICSSH